MSIAIMSRIFALDFQTCSRKMLAVKLADHADDEGCGIWPSVERLARECNLSTRQVQRILADFVSEGFLVVITAGGKGKRSTTRYDFDLAKLPKSDVETDGAQAPSNADSEAPNAGSDANSAPDSTPNSPVHSKGDTMSPYETAKGDMVSSKGDMGDVLGRHHVTQTIIEPSGNHHSLGEAAPNAETAKPAGGGEREASHEGDQEKEGQPSSPPFADTAARARLKRSFERARAAYGPAHAGKYDTGLKLWLALDEADREAAEARITGFFAAMKAAGRDYLPVFPNYLKDRCFDGVEPLVDQAAAKPDTLAPYGPAWWAQRRALLEAGPTRQWQPKVFARREVIENGGTVPDQWRDTKAKADYHLVALMDADAKQGKPAVARPDLPQRTPADPVKLQVGSNEWVAFKAAHSKRGWPQPEAPSGFWVEVEAIEQEGEG